MEKPPVKTKDELLRQQKEAAEQQRREANARAAEKTAKKDYPAETWLAAGTVKLRHMNLPKKLDGIGIAKSKFPMNKNDERTLLKEVKQAMILRDKGASVYLIPKLKDHTGENIPGPDAIANGQYIEFKSLFKIWNFGVANAKILPCRLKKSPKIVDLCGLLTA
ncbi:MAG: hypothetical protein LBD08_06560 [Treponema sp.]|jgi:hypothetical protein|nr:hypothetical protein [Treponema sp.]